MSTLILKKISSSIKALYEKENLLVQFQINFYLFISLTAILLSPLASLILQERSFNLKVVFIYIPSALVMIVSTFKRKRDLAFLTMSFLFYSEIPYLLSDAAPRILVLPEICLIFFIFTITSNKKYQHFISMLFIVITLGYRIYLSRQDSLTSDLSISQLLIGYLTLLLLTTLLVIVIKSLKNGLKKQYALLKSLEDKESELLRSFDFANMFKWEWNLVTGKVVTYGKSGILFGIEHSEFTLTFDKYIDLVLKEDRNYVLSQINTSIKDKKSFEIQHRIQWPDESIHWIKVKANLVCSETGEAERLIGMAYDTTTEQKNTELLQKKKNEADEESRIKTAFLSTINHELRTPMNQIQGFLQLVLADKNLAPHLTDYVTTALSASKELTEKIINLTSIAGVEREMISSDRESFSPKTELPLWLSSFEGRAVDKGLEWNMNFDPEDEDLVTGDKKHLKMILEKLVDNAIKFTEDGGISLLWSRNDDNWVLFIIKDTGIGFDEVFLNRSIEPFSQENQSDSRIYQGMGIGLYYSKRLIEAAGGSLEISSIKNDGSQVSFLYPLKRER